MLSRFALNHEEIVTRRKLLSRVRRQEDGQVGVISLYGHPLDYLTLYTAMPFTVTARCWEGGISQTKVCSTLTIATALVLYGCVCVCMYTVCFSSPVLPAHL